MTTTMVKIQVENSYTDGHESTATAEVEPPASMSEEDLESWWDETVFEHTGDGHYTEVYDETGERLGSCYTVRVLEAPTMPDLVGLENEWLD